MRKIVRKDKGGFQCSFCGKRNNQIEVLVMGPQVHICNECVVQSIIVCIDRGVDVISQAHDQVTAFIESKETEEE